MTAKEKLAFNEVIAYLESQPATHLDPADRVLFIKTLKEIRGGEYEFVTKSKPPTHPVQTAEDEAIRADLDKEFGFTPTE